MQRVKQGHMLLAHCCPNQQKFKLNKKLQYENHPHTNPQEEDRRARYFHFRKQRAELQWQALFSVDLEDLAARTDGAVLDRVRARSSWWTLRCCCVTTSDFVRGALSLVHGGGAVPARTFFFILPSAGCCCWGEPSERAERGWAVGAPQHRMRPWHGSLVMAHYPTCCSQTGGPPASHAALAWLISNESLPHMLLTNRGPPSPRVETDLSRAAAPHATLHSPCNHTNPPAAAAQPLSSPCTNPRSCCPTPAQPLHQPPQLLPNPCTNPCPALAPTPAAAAQPLHQPLPGPCTNPRSCCPTWCTAPSWRRTWRSSGPTTLTTWSLWPRRGWST